ncbi:MAG: aldo/keto reductase [Actinomycetota bacterium]|nr:aldo/keto reductase [Actinomycetota bacterium]
MTDMTWSNPSPATFSIGGDLSVTRLGFGAMRITGAGVWGEPADPDQALAVLRALPELGVDFIDTADSYGPEVSERLIHEALSPYEDVVVATKCGLTRHGPDVWAPVGRPEYLRQGCLLSLRRLGLEQIPLFQLHRIDPAVPAEEQFGLLAELRDEGLVRHVGLSQVSVDEIEAARAVVPIVTVQNLYNLGDRSSEDVLEHCEANQIGFIPWFPLAAGRLAGPGGPVAEIAAEHDASPGQVALAWLLQRSPVMLPIPGTGSVEHLRENVAAATLTLSDDDMARLRSASD